MYQWFLSHFPFSAHLISASLAPRPSLSRLFTSSLVFPFSFLSLPHVLFFPISFLLSYFLPSLLFSLILSSSLSCPRAQLLLPSPDQCWNSSWILTFQFMNCTACQSPRGHKHSPSIVSCVIKACCQANQSACATEIVWRYKNTLPQRRRLFVFVCLFVVCLFVCYRFFFVVVGERNN